MLNVLLIDSNYYHLSGLSFLIYNQIAGDDGESVCFLLPADGCSLQAADIIFRDDMVTIRVTNKRRIRGDSDLEKRNGERLTLHIPFITKNDSIQDVSIKIGKILAIAKADYNLILNKEEACWGFGLKQYAQLSDTERDIMILIGRGYNYSDISRILNRSQKTISTHYRNASRKMGTVNRADFYRYASFIANCGQDERNTLCL